MKISGYSKKEQQLIAEGKCLDCEAGNIGKYRRCFSCRKVSAAKAMAYKEQRQTRLVNQKPRRMSWVKWKEIQDGTRNRGDRIPKGR